MCSCSAVLASSVPTLLLLCILCDLMLQLDVSDYISPHNDVAKKIITKKIYPHYHWHSYQIHDFDRQLCLAENMLF